MKESSNISPPRRCACGKATLETAYCAVCGQKKYESRFTWAYVVNELLQSFSFEKGILYNLKALSANTGNTLRAYLAGNTKLFYQPWQFFSVACGLLFFLVLAHFTQFMGINNSKQAEQEAAYYHKVYNQNYKNIGNYLQDSLENEKNIDTLRMKIKQTARQLHDTRYLENDEKQRAEKQAQFLQVFTYLGFYFFPLYLTAACFILFGSKGYYFSEHLIAHLFMTGQVIFYVCGVYVVGFGVEFLLRWAEQSTKIDLDTFVILFRLLLIISMAGFVLRYISLAYGQFFEEPIAKALPKTLVAWVLAIGIAFLLSFVTGEIWL